MSVSFCCEDSSVQVHIHVHVQSSSIFGGSREVFVGQCRAVWLAKQHMGNVDSEINIELWRIGSLFIHMILRWSARCCGPTGEECLGETCCHVTIT